MQIKPKQSFQLLGTDIKIQAGQTYKAEPATNQPLWKEQGLVFCEGILLKKDEYEVVPLTFTKESYPFGLYHRNGHRLLCSDGVIRAAELAPTADTFFSVPAKVRVKGKWVSGYCTTEQNEAGDKIYAFRRHTIHDDKLPAWPSKFTPEHETLIQRGL